MRKEASLEQWKELYETTTRIKELKPWEKFWDMSLIGIRYGSEEDTVYVSILGRGGDCYGVVFYEGYEGLNTFLMLTMQERMNLSMEYAMANQKNLTCYWGNRDELTTKQRKIIKDLGYSYRGKNQWLYFLSFEPGYYPYNLDEDEVLRMNGYMQDLELALQHYNEADVDVKFEDGEMFLLTFEEDKKTWSFGPEPLPFLAFQFGNLILTDDELLDNLAKAPKVKLALEADIAAGVAKVADKKYDRPANAAMTMLADAASGMMLSFELTEPDDDPVVMLAETLIQFIFQYGAPKEVRVSNVIIEAGLEQICDVCGIKLRRVKVLHKVEEFKQEMQQFGM